MKFNFKAIFISSLILFVVLTIEAKEKKYPVASIPSELIEDVDAVVRLREKTFYVINAGKAEETVRYVVTVFKKSGRELGSQSVYYDKFRRVKSFKGWLYNGQGELIRKLHKKDIKDHSQFDGFMSQILLSIPNLHADAIANSGDHIFIGDWTSEHKRIFKLPRDGGNIIEFNVENLVDDPKNIAINNIDSTILITDNFDNEIVVLDSTGNFVRTIDLNFAPEGISIDGDNIIVSN